MTFNNDPLLPTATPRPRRVNKIPLVVGGLAVVVAMIGLGFVAVSRNQQAEASQIKQAPPPSHSAEELSAGYSGLIDGRPEPTPEPAAVAAPASKPATEQPAAAPNPTPMAPYGEPGTGGGGRQRGNAVAATPKPKREPSALEKFREEQRVAAMKAPSRVEWGRGSQQGESGAGGQDQGQNKWRLGNLPEAPATRYTLRNNAVIPAVMVSGINSDLPGQMLAQVSAPVYDTARHEHIVIPQGSQLIGQYDNAVVWGQERLLVAWTRIIYPDGKALDLGSMPGADQAGMAGFSGEVNHHYVRTFGHAALMSLITAGLTYSQNQGAGGTVQYGQQQSASGALSTALGQQLGGAASALLMKNLNVAPTIEQWPGYRFAVVVTKDIEFDKPYQSFDYAEATP